MKPNIPNPDTRVRLFRGTVAREYAPGEWLLMNGKERGFARDSRSHASLKEILETYRVTLGAVGVDEHSLYVEIVTA